MSLRSPKSGAPKTEPQAPPIRVRTHTNTPDPIPVVAIETTETTTPTTPRSDIVTSILLQGITLPGWGWDSPVDQEQARPERWEGTEEGCWWISIIRCSVVDVMKDEKGGRGG